MKASFLLNIPGTIADNLRASIEITPILKKKTKQNKSIKIPFEIKDSKHLVDDSSVSSNLIYSLVKNKSVKLPFVTNK